MVLEGIREHFPNINPKIYGLEKINIDFFYEGKYQNDFSVFKNSFSEKKVELFLGHVINFTGHPVNKCSVEIRMTQTSYRLFLFDGVNFKQSGIWFY